MEKPVRDKIMEHMEENNLFTKHQHCCRKSYSCVTQLIDVCDKWTEELDNKSNRKAINRNWSNQKVNPTLKTKTGNK